MAKLTIKTRKIRKTNHVRLSLAGSLEASNVHDFWAKVEEVIQRRPGAKVTLDMRDLLFIASCGWALILTGAHAVTAQNGALVLAGMIPAVKKVYDRLNLQAYLPVDER